MAPDTIRIVGLAVHAEVGVLASEKGRPQPLRIDVTVEANLLQAAQRDDLTLTLDYADAAHLVARVASERHRHLIESLAHDIGVALLARPAVARVSVTVHKPAAITNATDTSVTLVLDRTRLG